MNAPPIPEVWVFLGDSLTEGIGSKRISYVSELVKLLRRGDTGSVHELRFRTLDLSTRRDLGHFNAAAFFDQDEWKEGRAVWIVNLASEGTTILDDARRIGLIASLRPRRVVVLRGPLETIVRPSPVAAASWLRWVPRSWRGYAALDPRCYFSSAWWRRTKQRLVDRAKQFVRMRLLRQSGAPLLSNDEFRIAMAQLLGGLAESGAEVVILALPWVSDQIFPGTARLASERNELLRGTCARVGAKFLDWPESLAKESNLAFCRDGFHPSEFGARLMAEWLFENLASSDRDRQERIAT
jgi:hypothetical protein